MFIKEKYLCDLVKGEKTIKGLSLTKVTIIIDIIKITTDKT